MNTDDIKRLLAELIREAGKASELEHGMLGKYVLVRTHDAGIHTGFLAAANGRSCVLTKARRLWYWKVRGSGDFLSAIALSGLHEDSKLGAEVPKIMLTENCEIIECSAEAEESIRSLGAHNA